MKDALQGFNSTVLAYGQTGSGKTYTMYAKEGISLLKDLESEHIGIVPRVATEIFVALSSRMNNENLRSQSGVEANSEYSITLQMIEIYQESFVDLLCHQPVLTGDHLIDNRIQFQSKELKIKESSSRGTYIQGLTSARITSSDEILKLISQGERNRHVNSTR